MVLFNYGNKEITAKIVFYGPGLGGKTTNLQYIHEKMNPATRGKLLSLATETDRTLFFDFLPVNLGAIRGFTVRFQLYTVPGQVYYNATRRLVLKGADAVVFVADSQAEMMEKNLESLENMKENLIINGLDPETIPVVIQYNKRDLPNIMAVEELNSRLNYRGVPHNASVAVTGDGVLETFKLVTKELMRNLRGKRDIGDLAGVKKPAATEASVESKMSAPPPQEAVAAKPAAGGRKEATTSPHAAGSQPGAENTDYILTAVHEMREQIRKMEDRLESLLAKDDAIRGLLQQIKEKLDAEEATTPAFPVEEEEPIILKEEKRRKKGFFWNR